MNDSKQRKQGTILSYVSIIINTLVQLLYIPLLIRMLGQSEYGLYSLVYSIIGYLTVLDLGFGNAIVVYTAKYRAQKKYEEEKKLHGMFFVIFCIIGFVVGIIGVLLYFNIPMIFGNTLSNVELQKAKIMMLILSFNLVITFIFSIFSSIITAYEKFVFQKTIAILNAVTKPLFMIPMLFLGYKSITMTVVVTVINFLVLFSNYVYCKKKLKISIKFMGFDKKLFKTIFGYSIFIFLGIIVDKVNWSIDHFILGAVSGTIAVSIYSVASQLNTLFISLSTAISGVLLPKISKMIAEKCSKSALTNEFIKVGRIQYYIIFLIASIIVLFGKSFIIWWVGEEYLEAYYVAIILIIPLCFPLIQNLGISIMQAMNKYRFKAISTFVMAFFNIAISYFLAIKYGAIGTAIGTAIALIICNIIIINIYYKRSIGIDIIKFWKNILIMSLKFLIPIFIILLLKRFANIEGILGTIIYTIIYMAIYCYISYYLVMNLYEKSIIVSFFKKIKLVKND